MCGEYMEIPICWPNERLTKQSFERFDFVQPLLTARWSGAKSERLVEGNAQTCGGAHAMLWSFCAWCSQHCERGVDAGHKFVGDCVIVEEERPVVVD
jgi:hypothetical protein